MKEYKHLGVYSLILEDGKILLIKKNGGPYDGKLDLPGGTIEFCEKPTETLARELMEEVGIKIHDYKLFDVDSVSFEWNFDNNSMFKVHHIGIFYLVTNYSNEIRRKVDIDQVNDDSLGASFYDISSLNKEILSDIAIMELEKMGYKLN